MADPTYATATDLANFGLNPISTENVDPASINAQLEAASRFMDSYFRARYSLPLTNWDTSVRMNCCYVAARNILVARGYSPDAGPDVIEQQRYDQAVAWLEGVERQRIHPSVTETPVPAPLYQLPQVHSFPSRWGPGGGCGGGGGFGGFNGGGLG